MKSNFFFSIYFFLFVMQELPSEPLELRQNVMRILCSQASDLSLSEIRFLEDLIHLKRCTQVSDPLPKWIQGQTELFETDSFDRHVNAARNCQMDGVSTLIARLQYPKTPRLEDYLQCPEDSIQSHWLKTLDKNMSFAKEILEQKETSSKGIFQCPGCKSFDVDTEQKQTRSADEPMTIFCHCTQCNKRFVR